MICDSGTATDPASSRRWMLTLYHPPLDPLSFKKRCQAKTACTTDINTVSNYADARNPILVTSESALNAGTVESHLNSTLEHSLELSFTRAAEHACACVVRRLDLDRGVRNADYCPCPYLSETLRKGDPDQKKILHSCHIYTMQWLSERDISWRSSNLPITRLPTLKNGDTAMKEPELVKAVGAWSVDLQGDCANKILSSTGRIDTIPCDSDGLIDAKSWTSGHDSGICISSNTILQKQSSDNILLGVDALAGCPVDCAVDEIVSVLGADEPSAISENSSETTTDSDLTFVEEQADSLFPFIVKLVRARLALDGALVLAPSMGSGSGSNTQSQNATRSFGEDATGHHPNHRKRKRNHQNHGEAEDDGDEDASEKERGPPVLRIPGAMPLQDPSAKLACHFHVRDPGKYCDGSINGRTYKVCPAGFKDSKELRDHLKKKHCGPKHLCARCHTEFPDSGEKGSHEISRDCERRENEEYARERYILVGTPRRADFDKMKKKRTVSHEEHWFEVWRVLFPDQDPPASPYVLEHPFTAQFNRIGEEVIQNCIDGQHHECVASGFPYAASFCRHLFECLRERLRDEWREGRLSEPRPKLGSSSSRTDENRSTTINTPSSNDRRPAQSHAQVPPSNTHMSQPTYHRTAATTPPAVVHPLHDPQGPQGLPSVQAPADRSQHYPNPVDSSPDDFEAYWSFQWPSH